MKLKIPSISDSESVWKEFLRELNRKDGLTKKELEERHEEQIKILTRTKFINEFQKFLNYNDEIRNRTDKDMKYDRLRRNYDIRNKPEEELARYQKSQVRMIQEENYNG